MSKKTRKKFTREQKDKAVDDYISGAKTSSEIARELGTDINNIYRWKTLRTEQAKGVRVEELIAEGYNKEAANRILNMELELEEYKKKLAEQVIIVDLLKKLQTSNNSAPESELTGLIKTTKKSVPKKGRAK